MTARVDVPAALTQQPRTPARPRRRIPVFDVIVGVVVCLILAAAIIGPFIAPKSIYESQILESLMPPSAAHWLGTDDQGRDIFWRIIVGSRISLLSSVVIVTGYSILGVTIACLAATGGRWIDESLMRFADIVLALPGLVVALGFAAALGPSLTSAIIAMILVG